jgi:hypothetical protein
VGEGGKRVVIKMGYEKGFAFKGLGNLVECFLPLDEVRITFIRCADQAPADSMGITRGNSVALLVPGARKLGPLGPSVEQIENLHAFASLIII